MTMVAPILEPDTRIYICPTDEEEGQTRFRGKETEIYCLPERDSSEDLTSNAELMEAIKELVERTRRIEAYTSKMYRTLLEKSGRSKRKKYRRY